MEQKIWKPHPKQAEFIQLPFTIFEGFFGGSAGPGKTDTLMMMPILYGWYKKPGFKGIILRRTFPDLEAEIIKRTHEYYPLTGGVYNEQKKTWKWPWGSYIQFGHAEHEKDIRKYDSAEYNYIAFDELTHFTEFQYLYLTLTRCRSSDPDLPAIVRSASNPGNIGHGWVRKRFIEPFKEGNRILEETVKDVTGREVVNKRIFIPAFATDNPTLLKNDPNYLARMEMLPEAEKRAKIYGDWWTFSGQVFNEFRSENFPGEPVNALHVIKPFSIPEWWPKFAHADWGHTAATAIYWGAVSPDARLYVYREYFQKEKKIAEWANDFKLVSTGESIRRVGLCHSAFANRGEEYTLAQQFANYSGYSPYSSGRDRVGGKMYLHDFLRWKPLDIPTLSDKEYDPDLAMKLLRIYGNERYLDYQNQFRPKEPELNLPRLQIFETCVELIKTIPLCVYDENNPEDVGEFSGDDPYDSVRGLIKITDAYVKESKSLQGEMQKYDSAIQHLNTTGDQTSYYRRMDKIEKDSKKKSFGVRRHSSIRRR